MARAARFSLKFVLTPSRLHQPLLFMEGNPSLYMTFCRTCRRAAKPAENTVAGIVSPLSNLTLPTIAKTAVAAAAASVPHPFPHQAGPSRPEMNTTVLLIPAYSTNANAFPAGFRILGAKSNSQSRLLNDCLKPTSSPAGPLIAPCRIGIPRIHLVADRCSSSPR